MTDVPGAAAPTVAPPGAFISQRDDAPAYWNVGVLWLVHADACRTGGSYSVLEELCPKGSGAPPHMHDGPDESFYVFDGEITFLLGSETRTARPGSWAHVPRSTMHGFRVDNETARTLNIYVPPNWEGAVVAMAVPAAARMLLPFDRPPPDRDPAAGLMRTYGMRPVPGSDPLRPAPPDVAP